MELKIEIMHIRFLRIAKWRNGQIYNAYRFFELETTLEFIIPLLILFKTMKTLNLDQAPQILHLEWNGHSGWKRFTVECYWI